MTDYSRALKVFDAGQDMRKYAMSLRMGRHDEAAMIEKKWGLNGYSPEVVSTVLSRVATGLDIDAAIKEATS